MRKQWKIVTLRTIHIKLKTGKNMMKNLDEALIYINVIEKSSMLRCWAVRFILFTLCGSFCSLYISLHRSLSSSLKSLNIVGDINIYLKSGLEPAFKVKLRKAFHNTFASTERKKYWAKYFSRKKVFLKISERIVWKSAIVAKPSYTRVIKEKLEIG